LAEGSPKCGGKKHQGEGTCTRPAGWGTDHPGYGRCKLHGGSVPSGRKAALEQKLQAQAAAELARLDVAPVTNALAELQVLAGQAVQWKNMMAGKVNQLTDISYRSTLGQEQLRSELLLWERALDRCLATLTALARLDIDARLVAIEEAKAVLLAEAVREALDKAGATAEQQSAAKEHVVLRLRAIDGSKALTRAAGGRRAS
jgi:hypothetical protein